MHKKLESVLGELSEPYLRARNFAELATVGMTFIEKHFPEGIGMLAGAPASDGINPVEEVSSIYILGNREVMRRGTRKLQLEHKPVVDFELFVPKVHELWVAWRSQDTKSHVHEHCDPLLDDFYMRFAESPYVDAAYFISGCEHLRGPDRLMKAFERLNKRVVMLPHNYHLVAPPLE